MTPDAFQLLLSQGGAVDLSSRAKIKLRGPDRTRYLQGQVTNDVSLLGNGRVIESCLCNAKGKFEAHVFIRELNEPKTNSPGESETSYLIDAHPSLGEDDFLLNRLDKYLIADDCELIDVTDNYRLVHLLDPAGTASPVPDSPFSFNTTRFGLPGIDILTNTLHDSLDTGETPLAHPADWDALRITHGIPAWGRELTPDFLPPEAGPAFIERNISYTKGCYIGQETISRLKSVGRVNKQLAALISISPKNDPLPAPGWNLFPDPLPDNPPKPIGHLTSTAQNPRLDTTIALAYLKRDFLLPGTRVHAAPAGDPPSHISSCATLEIRETPIR
jgi:folate-binding protein YgfZ